MRKNYNKYNLTKQFLIKEYIKNKKSTNKIAREIGCSSVIVWKYLKKFSIPIYPIRSFLIGKKRPEHSKRMKGKNHPFYGESHTKKTKKKMSQIRLKNPVKYWLGKRRPDVSKKMKGNKYAYINGEGYLSYPKEFTVKLKRKIRKRDNYTCQLCGIKQEDYYRKLDIHHIDYNKTNCNNDNLITLCHECNGKANGNRDYYYAYFTYLMENYE